MARYLTGITARKRFADALANVAILAIVAFAVFPILWAFLVSLKPEAEMATAEIQYLPQRITFENYEAIWTRSNFPTLITNSAVVSLTTVIICTVFGTLAS